MRIVIALGGTGRDGSQKPLRRILRWTQFALLAAGVSMLAYCGYFLADAWMFQKKQRDQFEQLLASRPGASVGTRPMPSAENSPPPAPGGLIGRIEIPRLGVSVIVMEGSDTSTLTHAAGHIPGTALPGHQGNVGISAHRDTFFRPLRNIRRNDIITLTTLLGEYRYRVVSTKIVRPDNLAVLNPSANEVLTLVTCYPFYFIGSAPDRFIVRAERIV